MEQRLTMHILLLVTILVCPCFTAYHGHKVLRVVPQTEHQLSYLRQLLETPSELDFWTEPTSVFNPVDIQTSPEYFQDALRRLSVSGADVSVLIPDLERQLDEDRRRNEEARLKQADDWYASYHRLTEIMDFVEMQATACGDRCETFSIGKSYEKRELKVIKIGTPASKGTTKRKVWIDSGIHAREWISPALGMYIIERLVEDYDSDCVVKEMVDHYDWYIQAVINPDGYEYSWTEDNRLWRKTRSIIDNSTCMGVDCNRNYDYMWMTVGASDDPCSITYAGPYAFSEPEAKAQHDFMMGLNGTWDVFLTLHSYSQLWMSPWGYSRELPENYDALMEAGEVAVKALTAVHGTNYTVGAASQILYQSSGTSRDWAAGVPKIPYVYTVELRDTGEHGFLLPPDQIRPTVEETWAGVRAMIGYLIDAEQQCANSASTLVNFCTPGLAIFAAMLACCHLI